MKYTAEDVLVGEEEKPVLYTAGGQPLRRPTGFRHPSKEETHG